MAGRCHGNQKQEGRLGWEEKSTRCRLLQKRASIFQGSLTEAREEVVCCCLHGASTVKLQKKHLLYVKKILMSESKETLTLGVKGLPQEREGNESEGRGNSALRTARLPGGSGFCSKRKTPPN
ncbi:hypothetical protein CEXT_386221 [Caerostris extrusa]|uniref:Uncharacterized protein n=1 Tax=Caerostris extrusa TaxID=172846 RepID=A0AAV4XS21_CAEEX|nr:hypothetical protein CEXT_386221 [Caerostris extrusa]